VSSREADQPALSVRGLRTSFPGRRGRELVAVDGVSFDVMPGERLAVVGESGSGKTMTALSIMGLVPSPGNIAGGSIKLDGQELVGLSQGRMSKIRGGDIAIVFQDPLGALNPLRTIGSQIKETVLLHQDIDDRAADRRVIELLDDVGMADAQLRVRQYPHQLSGGMNQRAMIASALAGDPRILLADEPTTALDATTAAGVLELLRDLSIRKNMAVVLITHDLGVVAGVADRVLIMYAGGIVEQGDVDEVFYQSVHPYTRGLLASVPGYLGHDRLAGIPGTVPELGAIPDGCAFHPRCYLANARQACSTQKPDLRRAGVGTAHLTACHFAEELPIPIVREAGSSAQSGTTRASEDVLLRVQDLTKVFEVGATLSTRRRQTIRAVDGVSFSVRRGETVALVGESGSGKTTTARMVLGLIEPTTGEVEFNGELIGALDKKALRHLRGRVQVVFQNSDGALDPRMRVIDVVTEPIVAQGKSTKEQRRRSAEDLLQQVGLKTADLQKYPSEFSGGQKQRIGIARALSSEPDLIVCDEPVTALDASVQAQILNLLDDIKESRGISYLLIAHDLSVVKHMSDRVLVMYLGKIVEEAPAKAFFREPRHPYSAALISASHTPDPENERSRKRIILSGTLPSPAAPPSGCTFHTRCWKAQDICKTQEPLLDEAGQGRRVACHFPEGLDIPAPVYIEPALRQPRD
jgi:peptide/nickel transport system ATP-binding protein